MAGKLEYVLSLDAGGFEKPITGAESKLVQFQRAADTTKAPVANMGMVFTQAGYQVTDFATQVQMGTSATQAFSQQAPQLIGAFQQFAAAGTGFKAMMSANVGVLTPLSLLVTELAVGIQMMSAAYDEAKASWDGAEAAVQRETAARKKLQEVLSYQGDYFAAAHAEERTAALARLTAAALDEETDAIRRRNVVAAAAAGAQVAANDLQDIKQTAGGADPEDVKIQRAYADERRELQKLNQEQEARRAGLFATLSALKEAEAELAKAKVSPDADVENIAAITKSVEEIRAKYAAVQKDAKLAKDLDPLERSRITDSTAARVESLKIEKAQRLAKESERAADEEKRKSDETQRQAENFTEMLVKAGQLARERQDAVDSFLRENDLLKAKANGNDKLVNQLTRERKERELTMQIMKSQGLSEKAALDAAKERLNLEDRANGVRRRGILNAEESAVARQERRSAADKARDARLGRDGLAQADRLALDDAARRTRKINPERAAADLAKANGQADPGKVRREEKAEANRKAADPLYRVVKSIEEKFANIAQS